MSDEPSPLRLKPRLQPEGAPAGTPPLNPVAPPSPPETASASPAIPSENTESTGKVRLRPKLPPTETTSSAPASSPVPDAPAPITPPLEPPPAIEDRPRLKPRLTIEPAAAAVVAAPTPSPAPTVDAVIPAVPPPLPQVPAALTPPEPGKFKLKPKSAEPPPTLPVVSPSPTAPAVLPPSAPEPGASSPEPSPPSSPPVEASGESAKPKVPHVPAPGNDLPEPSVPPIPPVPRRRRFSSKMLGAVGALIVILGTALFFGVSRFVFPPSPPPAVKKAAAPVAKAPSPAPETAVADSGAISMPGKMVEKAKSVVAARGEIEDGSGETFVRQGTTPPSKSPSAGADNSALAPSPTATTSIAPGISATTSDVKSTVDASAAFRSWVANAKVSGVFQGAPPRALVNGRTVRSGQIIDEALGVMFDGINSETKEIIFKDKTGATVSRRY